MDNSIIGKTFYQLTFEKFIKSDSRGHLIYRFLCDCGNIYIGRKSCVIAGGTKSCGCRRVKKSSAQGRASKTHGLSGTRFQQVYYHIRARCFNPRCERYSRYGGRGIKCEWKSFNDFRKDMYESYLKHSEQFGEKKTLIERNNNDGNYSKANCRWATNSEQSRNTSRNRFITIGGKTQCLSDWIKEYGLNEKTVGSRIYNMKWDIVRALTTPVSK